MTEQPTKPVPKIKTITPVKVDTKNWSIFTGYEKAWAALVGGGMPAVVATVGLWLASKTGAVPVPDELAITAAITGGVSAVFSAVSAFLATTTPTVPPEPRS